MSLREHFLSKIWHRYPAAEAGWLDARSFKKADAAGIVAGRLVQLAPRWIVESDGVSVEFELSASVGWLTAQDSEVSPSLFAPGDLVAVELTKTQDFWTAHRVLLLAPSSQSPLASHVNQFDLAMSKRWTDYLQALRDFFHAQDFTEAQTPTLVPSPGTEPFLDPFSTEWHVGSFSKPLFLPTSPEFHLKQLLSRGWARVFELKTCFRNGEVGEHHQPEFLMLEWYRSYSHLNAIATDVENLFQHMSRKFGLSVPPLVRTTLSELFKNAYGGFELRPTTTRDELAQLAKAYAIAVDGDDSFDDVFFRLFLEKIEPGLGSHGPLLVSNYPPSQAALSRIGTSGFAERFEIYWRGLEIANAFHELNDPRENETRFAEDAAKKKALGKSPVPRDENLVRALQNGMPPSGGIALGVDRLFMALFEISDIAQTRAFPLTLS